MKRTGDPWLVDAAIVGLALLGLLVVVRLIVAPVALAPSAPSMTVAVVVEAANEVRRRPAGGFEWRPLEPGDALAAGELVFVGPSSYVRLSLGDDTVIAIEENSLVRMPEAKVETEPELQLVKGSVDVKSMKRSVTVAKGKTQIKLASESRARLSANGLGAEVELKSGGAALGIGGALEAGTRTTFNPDGTQANVERLSVKQLSPKDGERLYATDADPSATFAWEAGATDCELVLKGREARRVRAATNSQSLVLEPGFYSWRIDCRGANGNATSETRWLVVHSRRAPRLLAPRDGTVVDLSRAKELLLSWTRAPGALRYSVTFEPEDSGTPTTTESTKPRVRIAAPSREGRYCAVLRAEYSDGPQTPWSPRECFRVVTKPVLQAPEIYVPKREKIEEQPKDKGTFLWQLFGGVAYAAAEQDSAITLRWGSIAGARAYMIEVAEDRAFTRVVLKQRVEKNYFRWFKIARRNYYLRVRGIDEANREGEVSATQLIGVETEPPVPTAPVRKQVIFGDEVDLRWNASEALQTFTVMVARDVDFRQVVARVETKGKRNATLKLSGLGEFYWRVLGVDLEGQSTPPSAAAVFVIAQGAPDLLAPKNQERFSTNEVDLKWARRPTANYEVELSGAGEVERLTVSGTEITMRPGAGTWFWRVRGKKPEGPWSEKRTFTISEGTDAPSPASSPVSMPTAEPRVDAAKTASTQETAEEEDGMRTQLGIRAGFFSNFGTVAATIRPGIDLGMRYAFGPGELGAVFAVDYYPGWTRYDDAQFSVTSHVNAISMSLGAVYALHFARLRPYAGIGVQVVPMLARAELNGVTVAANTLVSAGGYLAPGIEIVLGPGALFAEVMLALSTRTKTPRFEVDGSGIFVAIGYRFSLKSTGRLVP